MGLPASTALTEDATSPPGPGQAATQVRLCLQLPVPSRASSLGRLGVAGMSSSHCFVGTCSGFLSPALPPPNPTPRLPPGLSWHGIRLGSNLSSSTPYQVTSHLELLFLHFPIGGSPPGTPLRWIPRVGFKYNLGRASASRRCSRMGGLPCLVSRPRMPAARPVSCLLRRGFLETVCLRRL